MVAFLRMMWRVPYHGLRERLQQGRNMKGHKAMHRRLFLTSLLGTGIIATGFLAGTADAATWEHLGTRRVGLFADHDRIYVGASAGTFDKIRLKVRGNALWIYDVTVVYGNGAHDDIPVRLRIPQGGSTRVIDLRHNNRHIKYVDFKYGHMPNFRGAAYVSLWGRH
jgi:hypothetical protein